VRLRLVDCVACTSRCCRDQQIDPHWPLNALYYAPKVLRVRLQRRLITTVIRYKPGISDYVDFALMQHLTN